MDSPIHGTRWERKRRFTFSLSTSARPRHDAVLRSETVRHLPTQYDIEFKNGNERGALGVCPGGRGFRLHPIRWIDFLLSGLIGLQQINWLFPFILVPLVFDPISFSLNFGHDFCVGIDLITTPSYWCFVFQSNFLLRFPIKTTQLKSGWRLFQ